MPPAFAGGFLHFFPFTTTEKRGCNDRDGTYGSAGIDITGAYYAGSNVLIINADGTMTDTKGANFYSFTCVIVGDTVTYTLNCNDHCV